MMKESDDFEEFVGWGVFVNSDLTEGRGVELLKVVCQLEATARRLAKGASVQGTPGAVREVKLFRYYGKIYGPIEFEFPRTDDKNAQRVLDKKREVIEKAKSLGMSSEELDLISSK
jgi:hypothetical protein